MWCSAAVRSMTQHAMHSCLCQGKPLHGLCSKHCWLQVCETWFNGNGITPPLKDSGVSKASCSPADWAYYQRWQRFGAGVEVRTPPIALA